MIMNGLKAYTQTEVTTSDPFKLILLLYDAALKHLLTARRAIKDRDAKAKGEHIGKAIEIINELINSLSDDHEDEAVQFLHGMYMAIIRELGRVAITNDAGTVELSIKYIAQMRSIWKERVMPDARKHIQAFPLPKPADRCGPGPETGTAQATYSSLNTVLVA